MTQRTRLSRNKLLPFEEVNMLLYICVSQSIVSLLYIYMKTDLYTTVKACNSLSSFRVALIKEVDRGKNFSLS